jgi:predicted SnoaL-like aldol condensation-catalyzing enzyme
MTEMQKIAVVRRYFTELWNKGHLEVAEEILAPSFGGQGGAISGPDAAKLYVSSYRSAFPNIHFTLLSLHCQADLVVACWVGTGAHDASDNCPDAVKPGKERTITGMSVYRLENGKIAEMWTGSEATHHATSGKQQSTYSRN